MVLIENMLVCSNIVTYAAIGDPLTDINVSPLRAVRRPGVAHVTLRGSNLGVAKTPALGPEEWAGVSMPAF